MKKKELLAPAGDFESLKAALHGGADAIYIGLKHYGARAFANNFTRDEVIEAIKLCHTYGVRLYVAMNTLVHDREVDDFLDTIKFLHLNGVDAVIMQDIGMIMLVREIYPNLEIHASTQFNNSSIDTLKFLKSIGVKRAVLSRELSLSEIEKMKDIDIEKEIFIHGALCVCYSGCCLFSSIKGNRSGNRGECSGPCRLTYKLEQNNKIIDNGYLLSTKELNTTRKIKQLINSNIDSLKIEGRMKSSSYVYFITKLYRNLLDNFDNVNIDLEEEKLEILFNRQFTLGHLFNVNSKQIINTYSSNHQGLEIGKVIKITKDKIKIKLNNTIHQEDGIRFTDSKKGQIINFLYDKDKKLVSSCDNICYIDNKINLKSLDKVMLTSSKVLERELLNYEKRKVNITFFLKAKIGFPVQLGVTDGKNNLYVTGSVVEKAINSYTSNDRITTQLKKTNDTPYKVEKIKLDCDKNIFIPIKELNELRRSILDKLTKKRCQVDKIIENKVILKKLNITPTNFNTILVNDEKELLKYKDKYDRIYITKKNVFNKYKDKYSNIYYSGKRNELRVDYSSRNLIHDISYPKSDSDISDYTFNVFNKYSVYYLHKIGYKTVTLSVELTLSDILKLREEFINTFNFIPNLELIGKARIELMTIKGDIFKNNNNVKLIDIKNRKYRILYDNKLTHIYNSEITDNINIYRLKLENINIRLDTTFI